MLLQGEELGLIQVSYAECLGPVQDSKHFSTRSAVGVSTMYMYVCHKVKFIPSSSPPTHVCPNPSTHVW